MSDESPADISVREATPADRVAVARVLDGALLEVEDLGDRLADGTVLVATTAETAVGAIVLAPEGPTDRSPSEEEEVEKGEAVKWHTATHVRAIAVRRKRRRNGIGTALVRAALERWAPIVADFEPEVTAFYEALCAECERSADGRHWALLDEHS